MTGSGNTGGRLRLLVAGALVPIAAATGIAASKIMSTRQATAAARTDSAASAKSVEDSYEFPLDRYPGFGRSEQAALRDDTIALWEAFEREQVIAACMDSAGFDYWPAAAFPTPDLVRVAGSLGIDQENPPPLSAADSPAAGRNNSYAADLSSSEQDRYYQALLGESAADITAAEQSGAIPDDRTDDFARGGCFGAAAEALPDVWSGPRQLAEQLDTMRSDIAESPELAAVRREYGDCVRRVSGLNASDPDALEDVTAAETADKALATKALDECDSTWAAGYREAAARAAAHFEEVNAALLQQILDYYDGVVERILGDEEFRAYLRDELAHLGDATLP